MNKKNSKLELLGSAHVPKALVSLGIPIMIGMLINALYNLVDAYFVGGLGESPMGAISIVFPLGQVVVGLGLMFGNGASIALGRPVQSSLVVLGEISISGTMIKVDELASTLQVCLDSGAKRVLIPSTSFVDFATVPPDLMSAFQLIPYQSAEDAVFKALGVE